MADVPSYNPDSGVPFDLVSAIVAHARSVSWLSALFPGGFHDTMEDGTPTGTYAVVSFQSQMVERTACGSMRRNVVRVLIWGHSPSHVRRLGVAWGDEFNAKNFDPTVRQLVFWKGNTSRVVCDPPINLAANESLDFSLSGTRLVGASLDMHVITNHVD